MHNYGERKTTQIMTTVRHVTYSLGHILYMSPLHYTNKHTVHVTITLHHQTLTDISYIPNICHDHLDDGKQEFDISRIKIIHINNRIS